jgi:prepilin-type N-terminal cleavage/methylation domain-containing protein/prepilin-type processing-associated H-X9-DG protein
MLMRDPPRSDNARVERRRPSSRRGFTLIELLVVIGIISVLMAILLPVLGKARRSAHTARCLATVRQLELAWQLYTQEHKGRSIPYYGLTGREELGLWIGQLRGVYSKIDSSRLCPEAAEHPSRPVVGDNGAWAGGVFAAWGPDPQWSVIGTQTGSYGFNGWLYDYNADGWRGWPPDLVPGLSDADARAFWKSHFFNGPVARWSEVPCFMDCAWIETWPEGYLGPPSTLYASPWQIFQGDTWGNMMGRICLARHGRAINISYCDGHAATVPLEQLWALYWRPGYVRPLSLPKLPGG